jgi:hypothetical protein
VEQPSLCFDWILETQQHCPFEITFQLTLNHLRERFALLSVVRSLDSFDLPSVLSAMAGKFECRNLVAHQASRNATFVAFG